MHLSAMVLLDMPISYDREGREGQKERDSEREREDGEERGRRTEKKDAVGVKNIKNISSDLPWKGT